MSIYPTQNIIDGVYRSSKNFRYNLSINLENSIFQTLLLDNKDINFIQVSDSIEYLNYIHSTININGHISSNYLDHFQNKRLYNTYHIKDFVLFLNSPLKILKKEDLILVRNRLYSTKKIFITQEIANQWNVIQDGYTLDPGIKQINLTKDKRKDLIILGHNVKTTQKIYQILQNKYKDTHTIHSINGYDSIINTLTEYKACVNLGPSIDSLYAMAAGCVVVSKDAINNNVYTFNNTTDLAKVVQESINEYDIKKQIDYSYDLINKYDYSLFEKNIKKYIKSIIMEPFIL